MAKWAGGGGGVRWGEREGSRMRENRMFFFLKKKEEQKEEERQRRRMQRNGLIGQEFVCVKTERWYIGKTHTHTRTR